MSLRAAVSYTILVLAIATPSRAVRFYVDGVTGAGDDRRSVMVAQDPATPWQTIGHALTIAHLIPEGRPHVIQIAEGSYSPATESFPLQISQTGIYLEGDGNVIIDAQSTAGILEITAPTSDFLLKDMSFVNGLAERGGVVYCESCSLRVVGNRIIGNRSTLGGDVIYQEGGRLEFNNNVVRYNGEAGSDAPLLEIHNTFADTTQRDVIRNNTFYRNETPAILTSGNRTDISSNIFYGTSGSGVPAIIDSTILDPAIIDSAAVDTAATPPLVRYNLFWNTDILLINGQDSVKVERVERDTTTLEELGVQVPSFVTNQPDTVAQTGSEYEYDIQVEGNKDIYIFDPKTTPGGMSASTIEDEGIVRWTPAEADTGRHEVRVTITSIIGSQVRVEDLIYNIRVYTPESFPDTTDQGPIVTVTFHPDTTGAIDSLDATVPVFSNASSAGGNVYGDPLFLNTDINRFELLSGSPGRDAGNPVISLRDPLQGGRIRRNDIGDGGGPINSGSPTVGTYDELTPQALPDTVATEGVPWTYDPDVLEGGTFYIASVITDTTRPRVPMSPPPTFRDAFGTGKKPPFTWTPTLADTGSYVVGIHVYTGANPNRGGRHLFTLRVRPENEAPNFTSTPPGTAYEDQLLTYALSASDPNGDDIAYSVVTGPEGLAVNASGLVSWTPAQSDVGDVVVQLAATDPKGASRVQTFTLTVLNTNDAPVLDAVADTVVVEDVLLTVALTAVDADSSDTLSWSVTAGADSATIDSAGLFSWTPAQADVGDNAITVQVADLAGAAATATFTVTVTEVDEPPTITGTPDTTALEDTLYTYQVTAVDEEGAIASYALTAAPAGMAIDSTGTVTWTPTGDDVGDHAVDITATDSAGQQALLAYTLAVAAVNDAPVIESRFPADSAVVVEPGATVDLSVTATDEEGTTLTYQWLRNGAVLPAAGASLSLEPDSATVDTVDLLVIDDADTTSTRWLVDGRAIPRLALAPDSADFGAVGLGDTATATLALSNQGYAALEISNLQVGDLQFAVSFDASTVPAGGQAEAQIRFSPTARGARASTIQFATDDPENATVVIDVSGTGVVPTVVSLDLDSQPGDQALLATSAAAGDTLTLDLYAAEALELVSYSLVVSYDPDLASYAGFDPQGPETASLLGEADSLVATVTAPAASQVRVHVAPQVASQGISADGILGRLRFAADSSIVSLADLELALVQAELTSYGQSSPDTVAASSATVSLAPALVGDFDGSGSVDFDDFFIFADHFGLPDPPYDLDGSGGAVDFDDFFIFADQFGKSLARVFPTGAAPGLDGLSWHLDDGPALDEVTVDLTWDNPLHLRGLALGIQYDRQALLYRDYSPEPGETPLVWVVEREPGWVLLAAAATAGQQGGAGRLGAVHFDRLSEGTAQVRALGALGALDGSERPGAVALALPVPLQVEALPTQHALHAAYPNPFNPGTVLSFSLGTTERVHLRVYDLLGRQVATVIDEELPRGLHRLQWRARDTGGRPLAAGIYLAELRAGGFRQVRKLMLLK